MKGIAKFCQRDPFRPPNWRWERLRQLVQQITSPGRCSSRDDHWIRAARRFLVAWPKADEDTREKMFWDNPGLGYAYMMFEKRNAGEPLEVLPVYFMEARLLAGQTPEEIAREGSMHPDAVRWYTALFFDVVEHLHERDWITANVLLPSIMEHLLGFGPTQDVDTRAETVAQRQRRLSTVVPVALPYNDASLKLFAYFGGPLMVDLMIHGFRSGQRLRSHEELSRWLDENWAVTIKRRSLQAASQVEINKYNALELINTHAKIIEIEQSDDAQEARRTGLERHIQAMLDDLPWRSGPPARKDGSDTARKKTADDFVHTPGELRDDELDNITPEIEAELMQPMPPPRTRQGRPTIANTQSDFV
jgi:hypothetical protein